MPVSFHRHLLYGYSRQLSDSPGARHGAQLFFAFTACGPIAMGGFGLEWQQALAAVFVSGSIIIILSLVGVLNIVINSIPISIRTGLTEITTAFLFLLAIFFAPLAQTVGGGYGVAEGVYLYPVIAPPLIIVGSLMFSLVKEIAWDDMAEGFSAYLTIIITPLTFSITEGMSAGFIAYSVLKTGQGRFFEVNPVVHLLALIFLLRYYFLVG